MTAVCVDTNLFLELYESNEDLEAIATDLSALAAHLVFPDIIIDEFFRNRWRVLDRIADDVRKREAGEIRLPSIIRDTQNATALC